jgi:hypothetical protein
MAETLRFTRGNLPHWLVEDHAYSVTIRLAGTISRPVLTELEAERTALEKGNADEEALTLTGILRVSHRRPARVYHSGPCSGGPWAGLGGEGGAVDLPGCSSTTSHLVYSILRDADSALRVKRPRAG